MPRRRQTCPRQRFSRPCRANAAGRLGVLSQDSASQQSAGQERALEDAECAWAEALFGGEESCLRTVSSLCGRQSPRPCWHPELRGRQHVEKLTPQPSKFRQRCLGRWLQADRENERVNFMKAGGEVNAYFYRLLLNSPSTVLCVREAENDRTKPSSTVLPRSVQPQTR